MNSLEKIGYTLIGVSIGIFGSSWLYEREIRKNIGHEEEYEPSDISEVPESKDDDSVHEYTAPYISEPDNIKDSIDSLKDRAIARRQKIDKLRTDYKNMYDDGKTKLDNILHGLTSESETYFTNIEREEEIVDDHPSDDYPDDLGDDDFVTERIEEWIEVYLDDNPQDFISLVYYEGDDTLCDDREQLISNPEDVVGRAALQRLIENGPGVENSVIFVRNLKTMLNYEVVLDAGKYSETVLGIFESNLDKGAGKDVYN